MAVYANAINIQNRIIIGTIVMFAKVFVTVP